MIKHFNRIAAAALLATGTLATGAQAQQPGSILYRVEGPGGATVYMLGSIHLLSADAYPLPQPVQDAYADAERVYFETSMDSLNNPQTQMAMAMRGMYQGGRTLSSEIPADLYAQVQQAAPSLASLPTPVPPALLDRLEPWMVGLLFQSAEWMKAGLTSEHGVDAHFNGRAKEDGKPVGTFESVEFQMGLFDAMPADEQVAFLRQTLQDLPRTREMMQEMVAAWRAGDEDTLDRLTNDARTEAPAMFTRLLTDRNAAWVPQIEQLLRGSDDVLVVVGAAHLVGDESVVAMLRQRGYTVEQL